MFFEKQARGENKAQAFIRVNKYRHPNSPFLEITAHIFNYTAGAKHLIEAIFVYKAGSESVLMILVAIAEKKFQPMPVVNSPCSSRSLSAIATPGGTVTRNRRINNKNQYLLNTSIPPNHKNQF